MNIVQLTTVIKKEMWEYQRIFLWLPVIIAAFILMMPMLAHLLSDSPWLFTVEFMQALAKLQHEKNIGGITYGFIAILFIPFMLIASLVQLHYLITCLFDERKDLSILFWRSLPVSDAMSVGVKLVVGALVLPSVFLLAASATLLVFLALALVYCLLSTMAFDISLWGFWTHTNIVSNVLGLWLTILPYTLWLLPLYAWLMLVSMFSSKAPLLWAVLPVVFLLLVENFIVSYFNVDRTLFSHALIDYFWINQKTIDAYMGGGEALITVPFSVLSAKVSVVGLVIAAVFIYVTYWLRANRSHG
jgi:ABC-2 type transport system permease protein